MMCQDFNIKVSQSRATEKKYKLFSKRIAIILITEIDRC